MMQLVAAAVMVTVAVTPESGGLLSTTRVNINTSDGLQTDPHVDGDIAAYTDAASGMEQIRFYEFSSNTGGLVPGGPTVRDFLSDISGTRVAFTRVQGGVGSIYLYDVNSSAAPVEIAGGSSGFRAGVGIGADTVAYADFSGAGGNGEILAHDLATSTTQPVTNDSSNDQRPAVSPDGRVIVWERCATGTSSSCSIAQATLVAGSWVQSTVSSDPASSPPDTNGVLVVYGSNRAGTDGSDIFWRPVAGGPESQLQLAGEQDNAAISGTIIAFESTTVAGQPRDIFIYDLSSNRLFQLTATDANEQLNDVTVLSDGQVRVVWESDDSVDAFANIYGATFSLPSPPVPDGGTGGGAGGGNGGGSGGGRAGGCGGRGGGQGGGTGGGAGVCLNRSETLTATKTYCPSRWTDGTASFNPNMTFALPAEIPVTQGNSGNHWVTLSFTLNGRNVQCKYRGGSSQSHPTGATELAKASRYHFNHCTGTGNSLRAGSLVSTSGVRLHVDNGDSRKTSTQVRVTLREECTGSTSHRLEAADDAPGGNVGCSSTQSTLAPAMMLLAFAALLSRRRWAKNPAEAARRRT